MKKVEAKYFNQVSEKDTFSFNSCLEASSKQGNTFSGVSRYEVLVNSSYKLNHWDIDNSEQIFSYLIGFSCFTKGLYKELIEPSHPVFNIQRQNEY